ncbi:hypothetical protein [Pannonibacter phragmitetus]|uniref:hypothetical protein n=1 Tax=Pannonibacter phragmitetus TaxID=121719 RepID=UPI0013CE62DB|nr:hypothetical protein [Pannonibacter phragmitetus]
MNKKFKRLSLIERSALTFQSYLNGDFGKRFYSDQFLAGICRTRYEMHLATGKAAGSLMLFSLTLAYFDILPEKVTIFSNQISVSRSMIPILNVFVSASLFVLFIRFIEGMIIDRYISRIGENIDIFSFNIFLLDKNPTNIWLDPLMPRYFGERSGGGHKGVLPILGILMLVILVIIIMMIIFLIMKTSYDIISSHDVQVGAMLMAITSLLFTVLSIFLAISFSIKFKFYDAHFDECSLEPTDVLKRELEEEIGAQPREIQQDKTAAPPAHDGLTSAAP